MLHSSSTVSFREDDLAARVPACTPYIACAFAQGWRLVQDGQGNAWNTVEGPKHLQDFKHCPTRKLTRKLTFRFWAVAKNTEGESHRIEQFVQRLLDDRAFYRAAQNHPRYEHWLGIIARELPTLSPLLKPIDPDAHNRTLEIDLRTWQNPTFRRIIADQYENGW